MISLNKSLSGKVVSNHILKFLSGGVNFLVIALIAKLASSEILGEFTSIYALIILTSSLAFWGMSDGLILLRKQLETKHLTSNVVVISFINWVITYGVLLIIFHEYTSLQKILVGLSIMTISVQNLLSIILRVKGKYKSSIYINSIQDKAFFLIGLFFFQFWSNDITIENILTIYIYSYIVSLFICLFVFYIQYYKYKIVIKFHNISIQNIIKIYKHNSPLLISDVLNNFVGSIDILILNNFLSFTQIANYKVASTFGKLIKVSLSSFSNYMLPELSTMIKHKSNKIESYILDNYKYIFLSSIILIASIAILGELIINSFFGNEYQQAYFLLLVLLVGYSYNNFSGPNGTILLSLGRIKTLFSIDIVTNIIGVILMYILTLYFSLWGGIIANVLMLLIYNYLKNIYTVKYMSVYKQVIKKIYYSWAIIVLLLIVIFLYKIPIGY